MTQHCYISGPHSDYYLLMDEQSDRIFDLRLAAHIREGGSIPEIWIDDGSRQVWYVFGCASERPDGAHP